MNKFWSVQWKDPRRKPNALNPALPHYDPFPSSCLHSSDCGGQNFENPEDHVLKPTYFRMRTEKTNDLQDVK